MSSELLPVVTNPPPARPGNPCVVTIFGASGDLTKRKLIPALQNLARDRLLPEGFAVVGVARSELTQEEFRRAFDPVEPEPWAWLERRLHYYPGMEEAQTNSTGAAYRVANYEKDTALPARAADQGTAMLHL